MWLAIMLACSDPTVFSCKVMIKSQPFATEQACIDNVIAFGEALTKQGMIAIPSCYKVKVGVDT